MLADNITMGKIKLNGGSKKAEDVRESLDKNTEPLSPTPRNPQSRTKPGLCRRSLFFLLGIFVIFGLFVAVLFAIELLHPDSIKPPQPSVQDVVNNPMKTVNLVEVNDVALDEKEISQDDVGLHKIAGFFLNMFSDIKGIFYVAEETTSEENKQMTDSNMIFRVIEIDHDPYSGIEVDIEEIEVIEEIIDDEQSKMKHIEQFMSLMREEGDGDIDQHPH